MNNYRLFKFRVINKYLIDSLVRGVLYFSHPDRLNDPFDCRVDIKKSAINAVSKLSGKKKDNLLNLTRTSDFDRIQKVIGNVGICSFSLVLENSLLWSHYANEHQGLCLTYRIPESFINDKSNEITGVPRVEYGDNPLTDWFIENTPEYPNFDFKKFIKEIIKKVLTIKSTCWNYEEEVRIIRQKQSSLKIPKEYLKQVCFGLNTPETDIDLIKDIISNSGYKVSYCKMKRNESDFGLEAEDL